MGAIAGVRFGKCKLETMAGKCKFSVRVGKYKLGDRAGRYKLGARAGKHKLVARTGKYKLGDRAGKYKLGARTGKCKLRFRARAGGQAKSRRPGNKKHPNYSVRITFFWKHLLFHVSRSFMIVILKF